MRVRSRGVAAEYLEIQRSWVQRGDGGHEGGDRGDGGE